MPVLGDAAPARAGEPCAELKLSGATALELPCPEDLAQLLESHLPRPRPDDEGAATVDPEMAVEPDWPHDEAMVAEHDWPHDQAMVVPKVEKRKEADPGLDEFLGLLGRFLSRQPQDRPPLLPQPRRAGYREYDD